MTGWTEYALALSLFVGSHFLPRIGGLRDTLINAVGRRTYFAIYGVISVGLLIWLIVAAGRAPHVALWAQLPWTRWVPNIAMPLAMILVACGAGLRYPYTLGGRHGQVFKPERPGFAAVSRHPMFLALALWGGAHLVPNGDLAHVILFGSFAAMALAAIPAFDAKARLALPLDDARALHDSTAVLSLVPLTDRAWLKDNARLMALRILIGLLFWLALLHLHGAIIGVSPFPV